MPKTHPVVGHALVRWGGQVSGQMPRFALFQMTYARRHTKRGRKKGTQTWRDVEDKDMVYYWHGQSPPVATEILRVKRWLRAVWVMHGE